MSPRLPAREDLPAAPAGAQVTAWEADAAGLLSRVTPRQAMILLLHVSWLRWHEYSKMLKEQVEAAQPGRAAGAGVRGLVGHKTSASAVTGGLYPTSEEIRALVRLEGQERDRCANLAKAAHDMGLTEDW